MHRYRAEIKGKEKKMGGGGGEEGKQLLCNVDAYSVKDGAAVIIHNVPLFVVVENLAGSSLHSFALLLLTLLLPPELTQLFKFRGNTFGTVFLHRDVRVEVVKRAVSLGAPRPVANVIASDLLLRTKSETGGFLCETARELTNFRLGRLRTELPGREMNE